MKRIVKPGFSEILFWTLNGSIGLVDNWLFPLELALVEQLFAMTGAPLAARLRTQFEYCNHFWRGGYWRTFEMNRVIRGGRAEFPSDLKIEIEKPDVRIASMKFSTKGFVTTNNAVFHLASGRLFSIEFGESYKPIRFESEIEVLSFKPNRELAHMATGGYASSQGDGGCQ
jgi:hypothetical protein